MVMMVMMISKMMMDDNDDYDNNDDDGYGEDDLSIIIYSYGILFIMLSFSTFSIIIKTIITYLIMYLQLVSRTNHLD